MLPCVPWHRAHHPPGRSSDVTTCPEALSTPLVEKGLRSCHVARGTKPITQQERALESPRASRLQAHPLRGKAQPSPRDRGTRTTASQGSGISTCPMAPDPPPGAGGLQSRHVPDGPRPLVCPCVLKMPDITLIMASPDTWCMHNIKYACDRLYAAYD
jgi:hypothetical protein